MQKAAVLLPRSDLDGLLALGRTGPEGYEFQTVREDVARRAVAAAGSQPNAKASEDDVALFEKAAEQGGSPSDPLLLGWYWLRRGDAAKAQHWFQTSYERENSVQSAEGLALALVQLKKPAEAEAALARWRDANDDAGKTYLSTVAALLSEQPPPVISPDVLARIVDAAAKHRDSTAAQLLGWYSHAFRQDDTAARWFATALAWKPDDESSAYGLAVIDQVAQSSPSASSARTDLEQPFIANRGGDGSGRRSHLSGGVPGNSSRADRERGLAKRRCRARDGNRTGERGPNRAERSVGRAKRESPDRIRRERRAGDRKRAEKARPSPSLASSAA
jgi:tetratricopeptide (TPR) repeat protein